jgi:hypothetical protein
MCDGCYYGCSIKIGSENTKNRRVLCGTCHSHQPLLAEVMAEQCTEAKLADQFQASAILDCSVATEWSDGIYRQCCQGETYISTYVTSTRVKQSLQVVTLTQVKPRAHFMELVCK